jgi:ABC-type transport system involved in multi-copper enzyme maturation permease subunit
VFSLLLKDLLPQLKLRFTWFSPLFVALGCLLCHQGSAWAYFILFIPTYYLVIYADSYDYKFNQEHFFLSCPIARWQWVLSKYALPLISLVLTVALAFIIGWIGGLLGAPLSIPSPGTLSLLLVTTALYLGVYFPFTFKLGYGKSRWVNFIAIAIGGAIAGSTVAVQEQLALPQGGYSLSGIMAHVLRGSSLSLLWLALVSLIILTVSFFISSALFRRREF